jgi:hypothetical protein
VGGPSASQKPMSAKQLKDMSIQEHLNAYDAVINNWMSGKM